MKGIWAKNLIERINTTLAFSYDFGKETEFDLKCVVASCYKIYVDGEFLAFGPQRSAHGYARIMEYKAKGKVVTFLVYSPYINSFCWIKQKPYFACEMVAGNKVITAQDFTCRFLNDRVQKVPKYSYQRCFLEIYKVEEDRRSVIMGQSDIPTIETCEVDIPKLLPAYVNEPKYNLHYPVKTVSRGEVEIDESIPVWREYMIHDLVGKKVANDSEDKLFGIGVAEGYTADEWEEASLDEVIKFVYNPSEDYKNSDLYYKILDFGRGITSFSELKVTAENDGVLYLIFDELLSEDKRGVQFVNFKRQGWTNVIKWNIKKGGEFNLASFEPYTVRYACIVASKGISADIRLRDYENPDCYDFTLDCADERVQKIISAAKATFAQNAVDVLTDCPSRERAGWLCDSYFSSESEFLLTGRNDVERTFLENYALSEYTVFPKGMVQMCYPADPYDTYIPNWGMFYLLELEKFARRYGKDDKLVKDSLCKVQGLVDYFEKFENELCLLEDLEGWVFVEWSDAGQKERLCGVNTVSNITYARALVSAGYLLDNDKYIKKAQVMRKNIKEYAFNGEFFVDNLVRDESGKLIRTEYLSEVCQYAAFWFECATKEEYSATYAELMNNLGVQRKDGYRPEIAKANVFYGLYMRMDLIVREGKKNVVLDECIKLFLPMAERTGTLWELNDPGASCNHGFASYVLVWLKFALQ